MAKTSTKPASETKSVAKEYFEDDTRAEIRRKLFHLTAFAHNILFLQAETATGKTTFLKNFFNSYRDSWHICEIDARLQKDGHNLFEKLEKVLNVSPSNGDVDALQQKIRTLANNDELLVIWIDHVEEISEDVIAALFAVYIAEQDRANENIRLIFSGRDAPDSLYRALKHFEVTDDKFVVLELPPLGEEQTAEYIMHLIRDSGAEPIKAFDESVIQRIYRQSRGQIGEINKLANELLQRKPETRVADYDESKRNQFAFFKIVTVSLVIAIVASLWIFKSKFDSTTTEPKLEATSQQTEIDIPPIQTLPEPGPIENEITANEVAANSPPSNDANDAIESDVMAAPPVVAPVPVAPPVIAETPTKDASPPTLASKNAPPEPIAATKPEPQTSIKTAAWINKQNPKHFTLQLVALSNEKAAISFIEEHKITKEAAYFPITRNKKTLYVVVINTYTSRDAAQRAIATTKKQIEGANPWMRSFAGIQQELR